MKEIKKYKESLAVTLNYYYKVALNNVEKKQDEEKMKRLALGRKFKPMEQDQKGLRAEKEFFHRTTNDIITNWMTEMPKKSGLPDRIVVIVELEFLVLAIKMILEF